MINNKGNSLNIEKINIRYRDGLCLEEIEGKFICDNKREKQEDLCKLHIEKQFNIYDDSKGFKFTFDFSIRNNLSINNNNMEF